MNRAKKGTGDHGHTTHREVRDKREERDPPAILPDDVDSEYLHKCRLVGDEESAKDEGLTIKPSHTAVAATYEAVITTYLTSDKTAKYAVAGEPVTGLSEDR